MRHGMFEADIAELYNKLSKSSLRLDRYAWPFLPYIGSTFRNEGNRSCMSVKPQPLGLTTPGTTSSLADVAEVAEKIIDAQRMA